MVRGPRQHRAITEASSSTLPYSRSIRPSPPPVTTGNRLVSCAHIVRMWRADRMGKHRAESFMTVTALVCPSAHFQAGWGAR